jgi:hypothetical protein
MDRFRPMIPRKTKKCVLLIESNWPVEYESPDYTHAGAQSHRSLAQGTYRKSAIRLIRRGLELRQFAVGEIRIRRGAVNSMAQSRIVRRVRTIDYNGDHCRAGARFDGCICTRALGSVRH